MTLNELEQRNSPYIVFFFTEFDSFAGQLRHSGWKETYNVRKILSPPSSLPVLAKTNPPCSTVSLQQLSYLLFFISATIDQFMGTFVTTKLYCLPSHLNNLSQCDRLMSWFVPQKEHERVSETGFLRRWTVSLELSACRITWQRYLTCTV